MSESLEAVRDFCVDRADAVYFGNMLSGAVGHWVCTCACVCVFLRVCRSGRVAGRIGCI